MNAEGAQLKVGVYICHCGKNIAGVVDVEKVADEVSKIPNVNVVRHYPFMCSKSGQSLIINDIKGGKVDRVVVAACSPRMHEETFRHSLEDAGLNPYLLEIANIREQCSWVHYDDREKATLKALELIKAAIARVSKYEP
ncbi:MAG: disulfide reductase, partial [Candidatus Methanomethylicota archaeon]